MRRTARLMATALVLLAAMSVGAFAMSSPAGPSPRASDLPEIVTALTLPASSTVAVTATTQSTPPPSDAKAPGSSAASPSPRTGTGGSASSGASASSGDSKSDSGATASHSARSHDDDHEVVTPRLHESDGHGGAEGHSSED